MKKLFLFAKSFIICFFLFSGIAHSQKQTSKVSPELDRLVDNRSTSSRTAAPKGLFAVTDRYQMKNNSILIEAYANNGSESLVNELSDIGGTEIIHRGNLVTAYLPLSSIGELKTLKTLRFARPSLKPVTNSGSVTSQGDIAQHSDHARSIFGVNGSGVKVGILSDSYDYLGGAGGNIATGDLPGAGNPFSFNSEVEVLLDDVGSDEGRAMMEIVHDVAPGASLAFHTAFLGRASFAEGIVSLANAGCDIVVDDITYFNEPYFQDGLISQAVDSVNDMGVAYFSSAGNRLRSSYESEFRPSEPMEVYDPVSGLIGVYALHDFDPGPGVDYFQEITIPANGNILLALQWSQPYASACAGCPGADSDLDFFIAIEDNDLGSIYFDLSGYDLNIGADPFEFLGVGVGEEDVTVYLVIGKYLLFGETPDPAIIKYVDYGSEPLPEYATHSSTIIGHHNAKGSNTTGAVRYDRTPAYGVPVPLQEIFSSVGGLKVLFDERGNPITPENRMKPDFSAVQGGNSTFFGFDYEGDGYLNFFGTSASAPHAAGIAALMKEKDPSLTGVEINGIMEANAIDMDDPFTPGFDSGFDYGTGHGFLSASRILAAMDSKPSITAMNFFAASGNDFLRTVWGSLDIGTIDNGLLNITTDVSGGDWNPQSVVFSLNGPNRFYSRDNSDPFSLFGEKKGNLYGWPLSAGEYELTATPYSKKNGKGKKGNSLTTNFEIIFGETVTELLTFSMIDPQTGQEISKLADGDTIDLSVVKELNIKADVKIENVRSLLLKLDGPAKRNQLENLEPYSLFGDFFGKYNSWTPIPGTYALEATPYSFYFGLGDPAPTQTISFTVIDSGSPNNTRNIIAEGRTVNSVEELPLNYSLNVYPNPTNGDVTLEGLGSRMDEKLHIMIFNSQGQMVLEKAYNGLVFQNIDLRKHGSGLYIVKMNGENFEGYKKVIVN